MSCQLLEAESSVLRLRGLWVLSRLILWTTVVVVVIARTCRDGTGIAHYD